MATRQNTRTRLSLVLLVPALSLAPALARGGNTKKTETSATTPSRDYKALCAQGNAKYASKDFGAAIELYRKAIDRSPHQPIGYYLLGEAQLAGGNLTEAEASWSRAALDAGEKDPALHARILFVTADLDEREKKWEDAKVAWQTYLDWAHHFPDAGVFPSTAEARLVVIDTAIKQGKSDEIVRQRIAATQDGGVFSDPSKSAPGK